LRAFVLFIAEKRGSWRALSVQIDNRSGGREEEQRGRDFLLAVVVLVVGVWVFLLSLSSLVGCEVSGGASALGVHIITQPEAGGGFLV
jgi:hypothetical protein